MVLELEGQLTLRDIVQKYAILRDFIPIIKAYLILIRDIIEKILIGYDFEKIPEFTSDCIHILSSRLKENYKFNGLDEIYQNIRKIEEKVLYDDILLSERQEQQACNYVVDIYYMFQSSNLSGILKKPEKGDNNFFKRITQNNRNNPQPLQIPVKLSYLRPLINLVSESNNQNRLKSRLLGRSNTIRISDKLKPVLNSFLKNQFEDQYHQMHQEFEQKRDLSSALKTAEALKNSKEVLSDQLEDSIVGSNDSKNVYMSIMIRVFLIFMGILIISQISIIVAQIIFFYEALPVFLIYIFVFTVLFGLGYYIYKKL